MGRMKKQLLQMFDLPSDVTSDAPRLEWIKNGQLQIENHHGISYFTDKKLKVNMKEEILLISGENLRIKVINPYLLIITGKMDELKYINR